MKSIIIETIFSEMNYCEMCMKPIEEAEGFVEENFSNDTASLRMKFHSNCHLSFHQLKKRIDLFQNLKPEQIDAFIDGRKK